MDSVKMMFAVLLAFTGAGLLFDYVLWRVIGEITVGTITGFQEKKSKFLKRPIVSFKDAEGNTHTAQTERIDRLLFILNRPGVGETIEILYRKKTPEMAIVYGYLNLMIGMLLLLPVMAIWALKFGKILIATQVVYIFIFVGIIVGGWILLKIIQRN
jgi:hypothetical protein